MECCSGNWLGPLWSFNTPHNPEIGGVEGTHRYCHQESFYIWPAYNILILKYHPEYLVKFSLDEAYHRHQNVRLPDGLDPQPPPPPPTQLV